MGMAQEVGQVYALLADGTTVEIRPAVPDDFDAVKAMHEAMSPGNTYLRFFNISRLAAEIEARRICRNPAPRAVALLALAAGEVVGVASYAGVGSGRTEVAFAVADHMHNRGIATLLLEHLVSLAVSRGITTFTAETLTENKAMLAVFADAGLPVDRHYVDGVFEMTIPLPSQDAGAALDSYLNVVAEREGRAEVASLRHVLAPESVVVIGASRRRGTAGRAIVDNIRAGGYAGRLYTVNPRARQIGGERCLSSVLDLPEAVDLAVIAVPAATVLEVAEQCGQRSVRSLVVITSGLDTAAQADLLAVCRRHGMRLVGPDCFGVAVPRIGLDATFAARPAQPGVTGLVMQSGGAGLRRRRSPVPARHRDLLVRVGGRQARRVGQRHADVVGARRRDQARRAVHRVVRQPAQVRPDGPPGRARTMPVLTVLAGRSGTVPALVSRDALFEQAGVITTYGFGELIEATALLATQPVPAGRTVAIVSNVGSAGVLAADACTDLGLSVHHPHGLTRRRLRALVPAAPSPGRSTRRPRCPARISASAWSCSPRTRRCTPSSRSSCPPGPPVTWWPRSRPADVGVPLAAVVLNQPESVRLLPPGPEGQVPAYGYPRPRWRRWPARPPTGPGEPNRTATCPTSPISGPRTPARWCASSSGRPLAGWPPNKWLNCSAATGYRWPTSPRRAPKSPSGWPTTPCSARC